MATLFTYTGAFVVNVNLSELVIDLHNNKINAVWQVHIALSQSHSQHFVVAYKHRNAWELITAIISECANNY